MQYLNIFKNIKKDGTIYRFSGRGNIDYNVEYRKLEKWEYNEKIIKYLWRIEMEIL